MKKFVPAIFITFGLGLTLFLAGCNTLRGIGQDVQRAGSAVENAAK